MLSISPNPVLQTWIAQTAAVEMAKAGPNEELRPGKTDLGGFRRVHARDDHCFRL